MNKFLLKSIIIFSLINPGVVFASQTTSQYFIGTMPECNSVTTNGGNLSATINTTSGELSDALTPGFKMTTNTILPKILTITATVKTTGGNVNSIFNIGVSKYIILGNFSTPPTTLAVNDIRSGSPMALNNANAIAYTINNPEVSPGLISAYDYDNDRWNLVLTKKGSTKTSITVPAMAPLSQTFDYNDDAGDYQAVITLSFI